MEQMWMANKVIDIKCRTLICAGHRNWRKQCEQLKWSRQENATKRLDTMKFLAPPKAMVLTRGYYLFTNSGLMSCVVNLPAHQTNVSFVRFSNSTNQSPCESNKQKARECENKNCCKTIKSCIIGSALHHTQQEAAFSIAHPFTFRLEVLANWCVLPAYFVHFEVEIRRIRYKMWTFPVHIIKLKESLSKESPKVQNISFFLFPDI